MATEAEIAWAAGLFEGEGTFAYSPNHVCAQLNMTDFGPVRRFHEIVGIGRLERKAAAQPQHADQLLWRVTDRSGVEQVLAFLRPWLGLRRIAQAESALQRQADATAANRAKRDACCKNGHPRTLENTYTYWHRERGKVERSCAVCRAEATRRSRAKLTATMADVLGDEESE